MKGKLKNNEEFLRNSIRKQSPSKSLQAYFRGFIIVPTKEVGYSCCIGQLALAIKNVSLVLVKEAEEFLIEIICHIQSQVKSHYYNHYNVQHSAFEKVTLKTEFFWKLSLFSV